MSELTTPSLTVAFFPIARTTFDIPLAQEVTDAARHNLQGAGINLIGPSGLVTDLDQAQEVTQQLLETSPDVLVIFQATFADSSMIMAVKESVDLPLILWAVPEEHTGGRLRLNSFCGINLAAHALTRKGHKYEHIYAPPNDPAALAKIRNLAKAGRARRILQSARLGRVGENPDGFETCLLDPEVIKKRFGVDVVQYDLGDDIFSPAREVDPQTISAIQTDLSKKVIGLDELDQTATQKSLSVYATLKNISSDQHIDGFAVRCWPEFFTELGCAACGAMSMMSDELVPMSCEADVNGTITQMILQAISGEPAFGTDIVSLDAAKDALVVWHCGLAPLSMADPEAPKGVTIHSNRKLPLLFEFTLKPGRVTIARLTESSGEYRLVVGSGQAIRAPKTFSGTSGLIQFDSPVAEVQDFIISQGLEHHISLTYGDHVPALLAFAELLNLPVLYLNEIP